MKKTLINTDKLNILIKKRNKVVLVSLSFLVAFILYFIISCFIQNRETMRIFIVINSFLSIVLIVGEVYLLTEGIIPLNKNIALYKKALSSNKTLEKVKLISIQENKENYLGVDSNVIYFENINKQGSKTKIFHDDDSLSLVEAKIYIIEYYHNYLISVDEEVAYE